MTGLWPLCPREAASQESDPHSLLMTLPPQREALEALRNPRAITALHGSGKNEVSEPQGRAVRSASCPEVCWKYICKSGGR